MKTYFCFDRLNVRYTTWWENIILFFLPLKVSQDNDVAFNEKRTKYYYKKFRDITYIMQVKQ